MWHSNLFIRHVIRIARVFLLSVWIVTGLIWLAVLFPILSPVRQGKLSQRWSRGLLRVLAVRLQVTGMPPSECALVVANHVSWIDPFLLLAVIPVRFVAKDEVRHWPVFGWLTAQAGTVFIQRERSRDVSRVVNIFVDCLKAHQQVALFPEGTTTDGSYLRPFKSALFQVAISQQAGCAPVGLRYRHPAAAWVDDMDFVQSIWRILALPMLDAELIFCPLIPAQHHTRRTLATASTHAIASVLYQASQHNQSETHADLPT